MMKTVRYKMMTKKEDWDAVSYSRKFRLNIQTLSPGIRYTMLPCANVHSTIPLRRFML